VHFVANFIVDAVGEALSVRDSTGAALSASSAQRSEPMVVFLPPARAAAVMITELPVGYEFTLPASPAGTRSFVALTGYMDPSEQPAVGHIRIDHLADAASTNANVAFVHASPDPQQVDPVVRNLDGQSDYPFARLSFGEFDDRTVPRVPDAQFRITIPGAPSPLAMFNSEVEDPRQITVLSGAHNSSIETLRTTNIDMRTWPWAINAPVVGQ
jgi:hypothetical protein